MSSFLNTYDNTTFCKLFQHVTFIYIHFQENEQYKLKPGKALDGFLPDWVGEFYAYYQWYYNKPSDEIVKKIPIEFLKKAYYGLHDLDLDLAVQKVGEV